MFRTKATASLTVGHGRPGAAPGLREQRFDQDELRHLLATAGALTWGITSGRLLLIEPGTVSPEGCVPAA